MLCRISTAALCAALLLSLPATAQDRSGGLAEDEVRGFFDEMVAVAEEAAGTGDWQGAADWMLERFAEGGSFAVEGVVMIGGPIFTYAATLDDDDIERGIAALTAAGTLDAMMAAVEDYSVAVEVDHVDILPNGEASAGVAVRETASLDPARMQAMMRGGAVSGEAGEQPQENGPAPTVVQSDSTCEFRLVEDDAGTVQMKLAACRSTVTF